MAAAAADGAAGHSGDVGDVGGSRNAAEADGELTLADEDDSNSVVHPISEDEESGSEDAAAEPVPAAAQTGSKGRGRGKGKGRGRGRGSKGGRGSRGGRGGDSGGADDDTDAVKWVDIDAHTFTPRVAHRGSPSPVLAAKFDHLTATSPPSEYFKLFDGDDAASALCTVQREATWEATSMRTLYSCRCERPVHA